MSAEAFCFPHLGHIRTVLMLMCRLRAAHPEDPDVVICDTGRGVRLLGSGLPTRAMGDCNAQLSDAVCEE